MFFGKIHSFTKDEISDQTLMAVDIRKLTTFVKNNFGVHRNFRIAEFCAEQEVIIEESEFKVLGGRHFTMYAKEKEAVAENKACVDYYSDSFREQGLDKAFDLGIVGTLPEMSSEEEIIFRDNLEVSCKFALVGVSDEESQYEFLFSSVYKNPSLAVTTTELDGRVFYLFYF